MRGLTWGGAGRLPARTTRGVGGAPWTPRKKTADESLLDALALEVASHLRRLHTPLPVLEVLEALRRDGATVDDARDAVDHGIRSGALVWAGEGQAMLDAGIVRGWR